MRRWLFVALATAGPAALAGCVARGATESTELRVPVPPQSVDIATVDTNQVATLVDRRGHKSISVVRLDTGSVLSQFDVGDDAVALAPGEPAHLIVVASAARGSALDVYSVGGARTGRILLDGVAEKVAGTGTSLAYVLVKNGSMRFIETVDLERLRVTQKIAAPSASASLAAWLGGPEPDFLVSEPNGNLYERPAGGKLWQRLGATGVDPVYSVSGNAIYALQRFDRGTFVSVIARPYGLPVRLFPVANTAARLSEGPDRSLLILERASSSANVRMLTCASPLVATRAFNGKRQTYADAAGSEVPRAQEYKPLAEAEDPPPLPTGDQC